MYVCMCECVYESPLDISSRFMYLLFVDVELFLHELNVLGVHYTIMNLLFCIFKTVHRTVWDRKSSCLCVFSIQNGEEATN